MFKALSPHAIQVSPPDLQTAIRYAKIGGFQGLEFHGPGTADLMDGIGADAVKKMFSDAGITPAGWGLSVDWRSTDENWKRDLDKLAKSAKAARALGADRCFTWITPGSNERALEENWKFHVTRFKPIAQILGEYGQRLGLEFIGPKTSRASAKFPFIWTMKDMLRLGAEIGPNVGLLVDAWHWYTSHGTIADLKSLSAKQVVYVHVNDAPKGIDVEKQIDNVRELPGETGVIDIAGFLRALKEIGYADGVSPEVFGRGLKNIPPEEGARLGLDTARAVMRKAGVAS